MPETPDTRAEALALARRCLAAEGVPIREQLLLAASAKVGRPGPMFGPHQMAAQIAWQYLVLLVPAVFAGVVAKIQQAAEREHIP